MNKYLKVKNWSEFQHYKDRTPPWIKLHNSLLDSYDFECLPDASKAHLLCIWMLASRTNNKIPNNSDWIKKKIGASTKVDLQLLIESDFLCYHDASNTLHNINQDATKYVPSEEERREEKTEDNNLGTDVPADDKSSPPSYEEIQILYNDSFPELPKCKILDDSRKTKMRGIIRSQLKTLNDWVEYFNYVRSNCTWVLRPKPSGGQNDIDWFLRQNNLKKTKEGSYDDRC